MEKNGYISFTRDRALNTLTNNVRITIDGDKLSNKYKIIPYSQLKPETKQDKERWNRPFSRSTQDSESELVVPAKNYGGSIDILPYIKKIDIVDPNYKNGSGDYWEFIEAVKNSKRICKKYNIPLEIYNSKEKYDYWSPSKYTPPVK
jgi:hypothetical protein